MRFIPLSIRRQGLQVYLDSTTKKHNGFGYNAFCILYRAEMNPSNIARAFNLKTRHTAVNWVRIHKEELQSEHET